MADPTRPVLALALCLAACGGLGNPDDSATGTNNFTTAVPPWMGTDSSGDASTTSTGGAGPTSDAPTSTTTTSGATTDATTVDPTGEVPAPKLDLPPSFSTGTDEDKDKDEDEEDKDKDEDEEEDEDKDKDEDTV